jgi:hypothetical protein
MLGSEGLLGFIWPDRGTQGGGRLSASYEYENEITKDCERVNGIAPENTMTK